MIIAKAEPDDAKMAKERSGGGFDAGEKLGPSCVCVCAESVVG